jgi:hypothetical protein
VRAEVGSNRVILSLKYGAVLHDQGLDEKNVNWQELAAHSKLETRLKEMRKYRLDAYNASKSKLNVYLKHGIVATIFKFLLYVLFLNMLLYVGLSHASLEISYQLNKGLREVFIEESFPVSSEFPSGLHI